MRLRPPSRALRVLLLAIVVSIASAQILLGKTETTEFFGDESGWISAGTHYTRLLLSGDPNPVRWEGAECGAWGGLNMNLGKWFIGIPVVLYSNRTGLRFDSYYDFSLSPAQNRALGRIPEAGMLHAGRAAAAVGGAACCLVLFLLGTRIRNECTGLMAVALTLVNPSFGEGASRAMPDSLYCLFFLLTCLAALHYVQASTPLAARRSAIGIGIAAGLACSVKVTGLPLGLAFLCVAAAFRWRTGAKSTHRILQEAALCGVTALLLIYGLNPYLWPTEPATSPGAVTTPAGTGPARLPGYRWSVMGLKRFPQMYPRWRRFMDEQRRKGTRPWNGWRELVIVRQLVATPAGLPVEWLLLLAAATFDLLACRSKAPARALTPTTEAPVERSFRLGTPHAVLAAVFAVNSLFLLATLDLNVSRYFLPSLLLTRVLVASSLVFLVVCGGEQLADRWSQSRRT